MRGHGRGYTHVKYQLCKSINVSIMGKRLGLGRTT